MGRERRERRERREIRVLPDHVVNQIAAGEVIERPASVVKELVENSLDAGARRVVVEIEDGGKTLIRVVDDGYGMSQSELRLAVTRHATSKLRTAADLFSLDTMGFRGEALPSIASVSRLSVTSRRRGDTHPAAWLLVLEGGAVRSEAEVGAPVGTTIEVRDLLFNTPARQKFMKADSTELGHISDCLNKLALANPTVHFRFRHRGKTALDAPSARDDSERVNAVLGRKAATGLISASGDAGGVRVRAFLGAPQQAQKSARAIQLFVGRRPVRDRGLLSALLAGYGEWIPSGRYPQCVLFVDVDGDRVDVNVHPQKHEVRFSDPQTIYAVVKGTVERAVAAADWHRAASNLDGNTDGTTDGNADGAHAGESEAAIGSTLGNAASGPSRAAERLASYAASRRLFAGADMVPQSNRASVRVAPAQRVAVGSSPHVRSVDGFASLRYLGQLDESFLVCEHTGELVLIDPHVAIEQVVLASLRSARDRDEVPRQKELFPLSIEFEAREPKIVEAASSRGRLRESLSKLGFETDSELETLVAIPVGVDASDAPSLARELIATTGDEQRLVRLACYQAVRRSTLTPVLDRAEVARLLSQLDISGVASLATPACCGARRLVIRAAIDELAGLLGSA